MSKIKIFSGVGLAVFVVSFAGGYVYFQSEGTKLSSSQSSNGQVEGAQTSDQSSSASQAVPLTQTNQTPAVSGLQVGSNSGYNSATQALGTQFADSQSVGNQAQRQSQNQNQPNPFDPTTFTQYDKYKNDTSASFAEVLAGDGATLDNNKKAAVYYRGWLTNGTKFDESRAGADGKLTPFIFTMGAGQVIPGWEQALAGMKVGSVRLVIVPPAAGYGNQQQNGIPPNSVLVFQVQLAEVQ